MAFLSDHARGGGGGGGGRVHIVPSPPSCVNSDTFVAITMMASLVMSFFKKNYAKNG